MDINKFKNELRFDEGQVLHAYEDSRGFLTIGIGRMIDEREGGGISEEEAHFLFENDVKRVMEETFGDFPWLKDAPDDVQRAVCNMVFQMGIKRVRKFKKTLSFLQNKEYYAAADEALDSDWAKQTPNRARRVTEQIRMGNHLYKNQIIH
ncbi:MAG: glycoside hydrolase family protein [Bacteroidota bacterium]